jgi:hypothetical protein
MSDIKCPMCGSAVKVGVTSWTNNNARINQLEAALERLGSSEAFECGRALNSKRDAELIARMDYARKVFGKPIREDV